MRLCLIVFFFLSLLSLAYSKSTDSLLNEALEATTLGKHDEAIRLYQRVIEKEPNHVPALQGLGLNTFSLGRYRESQQYLERAYSLNRRNLTTLILLGHLFEAKGALRKAKSYYQEALQVDPKSVDAMLGIATIHERLGNTEAAILALKRSIELQEGNIANYIALGRQYGWASRFEEGIDILKKALKLAPHRQDVMADLGYMYLANNGWDEAEKMFRSLLRLNPKNADALAGLRKIKIYRRPVYTSRLNAIEFKDAAEIDSKERQYQLSQELIYKFNQYVLMEGRYQKNYRFKSLEDMRKDYSFSQDIYSIKFWGRLGGGWSGATRFDYNRFNGEPGNEFDFEKDVSYQPTSFAYLLYEQQKYYGLVSWTRGLYLQTLTIPRNRLRMNRYFDYGITGGWNWTNHLQSLIRYDYLDYSEQHDRHDAEFRLLWTPERLRKFEFSYSFGILTDPAARLNALSARFKDTLFSNILFDALFQTMINNNKNDGGHTWSNTFSCLFSIPFYKEATLNLIGSWIKEYRKDNDVTQTYRTYIEIPFGIF